MKLKITILLSATLFFSAMSYAQEEQKTFKQKEGDQTFEVNFDPGSIFGSNSGGQFDYLGGIRYRTFTTDSNAFRIGVNLSYNKNTQIIQQENQGGNNDLVELKEKDSRFGISLLGGKEFHFSGTKRLSPFVGYQGLVGYSRTVKNTDVQPDLTDNDTYTNTWKNANGTDGFSIGAGVFAGFDYYFVKNLYLGVELDFGFAYTKRLKTTFEHGDDNDLNTESKNGSGFSIAPSLTTANLRFGWIF